jgi:hypothetical protein
MSKLNISIIEDIKSKDKIKVKKAFNKLYKNGNISIIQSLIDIYCDQDNYAKSEIKKILSQLKVSKTLPILINNLEASNNEIKELILHSIWSSNLDAEEHLTLIVKAAIEGNFIVAFEALTLIENLETINNESIIIESMILINEYISEKDDDKIDLIKSMLDVLQHFEAQLQLN